MRGPVGHVHTISRSLDTSRLAFYTISTILHPHHLCTEGHFRRECKAVEGSHPSRLDGLLVRRISRVMSGDEEPHYEADAGDGQKQSTSPLPMKPTPVRFKSSQLGNKRRKVSPSIEAGSDSSERPRHRRSRHRHHHRSSKRRQEGSTQESQQPTFEDASYIDHDTAFRESLFDAMADDEGADFWEGVYGQPIHRYPNAKDGPDGELERMTDEEYVTHVRARMWEKSHEHILEERRLREEAARKQKEEKKQSTRMRAEADFFDKQMAESLKRGGLRRARKSWKEAWERYEREWQRFIEVTGDKQAKPGESVSIPWPVRSGKVEDVTKAEVEAFMQSENDNGKDLSTRLKPERVRYHPDKMQQRVGAERLSQGDIRAVTKTFQIIDELYNRNRKR